MIRQNGNIESSWDVDMKQREMKGKRGNLHQNTDHTPKTHTNSELTPLPVLLGSQFISCSSHAIIA